MHAGAHKLQIMLSKIEALRKQPKKIRDRYAFYSAFMVTLVIAIIWGFSLPIRYGNITQGLTDGAPTETSGGFVRALSDIKSQFTASLSQVKEILPEQVLPTTDDTSAQTRATSTMLDIEAVWSGSSTVSNVPQSEPNGRVILIGTTSASIATSSSPQ